MIVNYIRYLKWEYILSTSSQTLRRRNIALHQHNSADVECEFISIQTQILTNAYRGDRHCIVRPPHQQYQQSVTRTTQHATIAVLEKTPQRFLRCTSLCSCICFEFVCACLGDCAVVPVDRPLRTVVAVILCRPLLFKQLAFRLASIVLPCLRCQPARQELSRVACKVQHKLSLLSRLINLTLERGELHVKRTHFGLNVVKERRLCCPSSIGMVYCSTTGDSGINTFDNNVGISVNRIRGVDGKMRCM